MTATVHMESEELDFEIYVSYLMGHLERGVFTSRGVSYPNHCTHLRQPLSPKSSPFQSISIR